MSISRSGVSSGLSISGVVISNSARRSGSNERGILEGERELLSNELGSLLDVSLESPVSSNGLSQTVLEIGHGPSDGNSERIFGSSLMSSRSTEVVIPFDFRSDSGNELVDVSVQLNGVEDLLNESLEDSLELVLVVLVSEELVNHSSLGGIVGNDSPVGIDVDGVRLSGVFSSVRVVDGSQVNSVGLIEVLIDEVELLGIGSIFKDFVVDDEVSGHEPVRVVVSRKVFKSEGSEEVIGIEPSLMEVIVVSSVGGVKSSKLVDELGDSSVGHSLSRLESSNDGIGSEIGSSGGIDEVSDFSGSLSEVFTGSVELSLDEVLRGGRFLKIVETERDIVDVYSSETRFSVRASNGFQDVVVKLVSDEDGISSRRSKLVSVSSFPVGSKVELHLGLQLRSVFDVQFDVGLVGLSISVDHNERHSLSFGLVSDIHEPVSDFFSSSEDDGVDVIIVENTSGSRVSFPLLLLSEGISHRFELLDGFLSHEEVVVSGSGLADRPISIEGFFDSIDDVLVGIISGSGGDFALVVANVGPFSS